MTAQPCDDVPHEIVRPCDWDYVVRLCGYLSGDSDAAEDLAQESLLLAYRLRADLRDPGARRPWLSAIARNVCRRWRRSRHAERLRTESEQEPSEGYADEWAADEFDLELELERHELAELLDRAMALLPEDTRGLLVERYIEDSPYAEIAERFAMVEGTVRVKVHRGALMLRRILLSEFPQEAESYGLVATTTEEWNGTRIWCPLCGGSRLLARREAGHCPLFVLRCPTCTPGPDAYVAHIANVPGVLDGVRGYRPALKRMKTWAQTHYRTALAQHESQCPGCGRGVALRRVLPDSPTVPSSQRGQRGAYASCAGCGATTWTTLSSLSFWTDEAQAFWGRHPRVRTLPDRHVGEDNGSLILTRFESATDSVYLDVLCDPTTYDVCQVVQGNG